MLDGLRGVAILLVMLMHTAILGRGYIGVDVFFGLSGFLITSLLLEEHGRTGAVSLRRFFGRRARRLLPALFLLLAIFALLDVAFAPFTGWPLGLRVLTTLTFVNNWVAGLGSQGLGALNPTWSLAMEDQFYLLWPLALLLFLRHGVEPRRMIGWLLLVVVALVAVVPVLQRVVPAYSLYYSPLDRFAELLLGCVAAIAWRHRFFPRVLTRQVVGWLALGVVLALLATDPAGDRVVDVYLAAALSSVVLLVNLVENGEGRLARLVGCRLLRAIGRVSYGLYLFNLLVHNLVLHWLGGHSTLFYLPIDFTISFLLAALSWRLLESRVLAGGSRRPRPLPAG